MIKFTFLALSVFIFSFDLAAQNTNGKFFINDAAIYRNYPEVLNDQVLSLFSIAPGGLVNYLNEMDFTSSSITQFNQVGSFGLFDNGINSVVKTEKYRFSATGSYRNYTGFRQHNNEYGTTIKALLQANPGKNSRLEIRGYYLSGTLKMPGSLLKNEFETDPFMADQRSIDRDEKRVTTRGRSDIIYSAYFGKSLNNQIRVATFGKVESYIRTTKEYKIINRYGFGATANFQNTTRFGIRKNELSLGGELLTQPEKTEYYENFGGIKSDNLEQLTDENIRSTGFYVSDNFEILTKKLFVVLTGKYNNDNYHISEETLPSRYDRKTFKAFTPKLVLNYQVNDGIKIFASYGLSFISPTVKELESPDPAFLYNQDLKAQSSGDFEFGMNGDQVLDSSGYFNSVQFEAVFFNHSIDNEIVPFEVFGEEYYRNATKANRLGIELGSRLKFLKDFVFSFSYTFAHFTYQTDTVLSFETENDSSENIVKISRDFSGNTEPGIPANRISLELAYEHRIKKIVDIFANIRYTWQSGFWVDDANSDKTDSYEIFNGLAGFDINFGHFNILFSGGVNNIFNRLFVGYATINSANKRFYNPGAPRDYYCSLNFIYTF